MTLERVDLIDDRGNRFAYAYVTRHGVWPWGCEACGAGGVCDDHAEAVDKALAHYEESHP